jgi:hypothetical protein
MKKILYKKTIQASGFLLTSLLALSVQAQSTQDTGSSQSSQSTSSPQVEGGRYTQPRFRTTVSLSEGYDDNSQTDQSKSESTFTSVSANGLYNLGNSRTAFTIGVGAGLDYYDNRPGTSSYDYEGNLSLHLAEKVNQRLTLSLDLSLVDQVQPDFSLNTQQPQQSQQPNLSSNVPEAQPNFTLNSQQTRVSGQYFYGSINLSAGYEWTRRFSTTTTYSAYGTDYADQATGIAGDYVSQTFGNSFNYQLLPTTTVVAQYQLGLVNYFHQPENNSYSNTISAGFDHKFSPKFTVTLRAGGSKQEQRTGGSSTTPYGDASLNYANSRSSSVQLVLHYGFDYSGLAIGQNDTLLRIGVVYTQGFSPKLSMTFGFFYDHDDYSAVSGSSSSLLTSSGAYTEDTFNIATGVNFQVTPKFSLHANYQRTVLNSNVASLEYNRDVVSIGGSYSF